MRRIAITHAQALTPRGRLTVDGFEKAPAPFQEIRRFRVDDFPVKIAAEIECHDQTATTTQLLSAIRLQKKMHARLGLFVGTEPERVTLEALARAQAAT